MKTHLAILLLAIAALTGCQWLKTNVPIVNNRNPDGTFTTPVCPQCGQKFSDGATVYRCANNHYGVSVWAGSLLGRATGAPTLFQPLLK